jgi:hypothetical protein
VLAQVLMGPRGVGRGRNDEEGEEDREHGRD